MSIANPEAFWASASPGATAPEGAGVLSPADPGEVLGELRPPLVLHHRSFGWLTDKICSIAEEPPPRWWWVAAGISGTLALLMPLCLTYLVSTGVGVWGNNQPVFWAWDITNFVFWIGIGHAGTLISAILYLARQRWRTAISRASEAMTIFAVMCAAIFPLFHVGRVWMAWYLFPIPWFNGVWPNFRAALLWDVAAVSTYFTVSLLYWYTGLVPDFATMRDRAKKPWKKKLYHILSFGWAGSCREWRHYEMAYLCLAGLSTPLVLSVHSVVSTDFAINILPGWHATIFPPYFVAGAIFGGFAMVLTILLPFRVAYPQLQDVITPKHIDNMAKILLLTGSLVGYSYLMEFFIAWYGANPYERYTFWNRVTGPYWWAWTSMIVCNVIAPQFLWFPRLRANLWVVFIVANFANVGMWFERFVIIVTSLHRDFLPSSWAMFHPTPIDIGLFTGSIAFFVFMFLLFSRVAPVVALAEVKGVLPEADVHQPQPVAPQTPASVGP